MQICSMFSCLSVSDSLPLPLFVPKSKGEIRGKLYYGKQPLPDTRDRMLFLTKRFLNKETDTLRHSPI